MQPRFVFAHDIDGPVSGRTPAARHASSSGAQAVAVVRGWRVGRVLAAFRAHGRLTIASAAVVTGIKESSICSLWNRLEHVGWIEGTGEYRMYEAHGRAIRQEWHRLTAEGITQAAWRARWESPR